MILKSKSKLLIHVSHTTQGYIPYPLGYINVC